MRDQITLQQFLEGDSLTYRGADFKPKVATYRTGVGIFIEDKKGKDLGMAEVPTDDGATRFYHNATRG